ncbi:MAG TPA: hypothetical protein VEC57_03970 [Candidatus Limnocylindrales bacterium]|nr:hypothetical protein [Candidatus Limnocylindrales bacterium]
MFLKWLMEVFPRDMRRGWALVRRDLVLWVAISFLLSLAIVALPPVGSEPTSQGLLPALIGLVASLVTFMLPPFLFAVEAQHREVSWGPVLRHLVVRIPAFLASVLLAFLCTEVVGMLAHDAVALALGTGEPAQVLAVLTQQIILVSLLVRFSFFPFLVILFHRADLPPQLWELQRAAPLGAALWPFTASSRLTEGIRWQLVPYTVLGLAMPLLAPLAGPKLILPVSIVARIFLLTLQAVLFCYFLERLRARDAPQPPIPHD